MKINADGKFDINKAMTQVSGEVSIKYMFFNLPMMFEKNKKSGRYSIEINKSLGF